MTFFCPTCILRAIGRLSSKYMTVKLFSYIVFESLKTGLCSTFSVSKGAFRLCNLVSNFIVAREKLLGKLQARAIFRTRGVWIFIAWIFIARNFIAQ